MATKDLIKQRVYDIDMLIHPAALLISGFYHSFRHLTQNHDLEAYYCVKMSLNNEGKHSVSINANHALNATLEML